MITPHPAEAHHVPTRIIPGEVKLLKWDFLRNWSCFCGGPCVEDLIVVISLIKDFVAVPYSLKLPRFCRELKTSTARVAVRGNVWGLGAAITVELAQLVHEASSLDPGPLVVGSAKSIVAKQDPSYLASVNPLH